MQCCELSLLFLCLLQKSYPGLLCSWHDKTVACQKITSSVLLLFWYRQNIGNNKSMSASQERHSPKNAILVVVLYCCQDCPSCLANATSNGPGNWGNLDRDKDIQSLLVLYCCQDCPSWIANTIQMDQATGAIWTEIKIYSPVSFLTNFTKHESNWV